jgi:hypothetical protein
MSDNTKRNSRKKIVSGQEMISFLEGLALPVKPTLHINGSAFQMAVLTVDFGEPKESFRLNNDQMHELVSNMRSLAREVLGRDASININTDNSRGVFYASVG